MDGDVASGDQEEDDAGQEQMHPQSDVDIAIAEANERLHYLEKLI